MNVFGNHFDKSIIDILIDLKPHDDMTAVVCERDILIRPPTRPTIHNPLLGKALLRLPAFYAKFLLISSSDFWTFTTTGRHRCGVTVVIPQVRTLRLIIPLLLRRPIEKATRCLGFYSRNHIGGPSSFSGSIRDCRCTIRIPPILDVSGSIQTPEQGYQR